MDCDWEIIGEYQHGQPCQIRCRKCRTVRTAKNPFRYYKPCPKGGGRNGPGAKLTELMTDLEITGPAGCSCKAMARRMDVRGTEWCKQNIALIVADITKSAQQLDWITYLQNSARAAAGGFFSLESIVQEAIRQAESKALQ